MIRFGVAAGLILLFGCATIGAPEHATLPVRAPGCDQTVHAPRPDYGHNPTVDWQPEALTKVPPHYPDAAREANVEGTVWVAALVCEHGHVVDARLIRSVPGLDAAALECIRYWVYRPAHTGTDRFPCWVEVPIRFSLR